MAGPASAPELQAEAAQGRRRRRRRQWRGGGAELPRLQPSILVVLQNSQQWKEKLEGWTGREARCETDAASAYRRKGADEPPTWGSMPCSSCSCTGGGGGGSRPGRERGCVLLSEEVWEQPAEGAGTELPQTGRKVRWGKQRRR